MKESFPETLRVGERILLRLDDPPWGALYRIGIGYATFSLFNCLSGGDEPDWRIILLFIGVLFAMRLIPAIVRKVVPFSQEVTKIWTKKRQLAKDFDSYQWQKLFWFGIGMAAYVAMSESSAVMAYILSGFSLLTGGMGLYRWQGRASSQ